MPTSGACQTQTPMGMVIDAHDDGGQPGRHAKRRQHEQQCNQRNQGNQYAEPQVSGRVENLLKHCEVPFARDAVFLSAPHGRTNCREEA